MLSSIFLFITSFFMNIKSRVKLVKRVATVANADGGIDTALSIIDFKRSLSNKDVGIREKLTDMALRFVKTLVVVIRGSAIIMFCTTAVTTLMVTISCAVLIGVLGALTHVVMDGDAVSDVRTVAVNQQPDSSPSSGGTTGSMSSANAVMSASTQQVIAMSDDQLWSHISGGRYSSYNDANQAAQTNWESEKAFWEGNLVSVTVPVWKWADDSHTSKVSGTTTIRVNKGLADFWKDFMTDLYNLPEKYVINQVGGYNFRTKNNGTGTKNLSAHSFGTVLDINWSSNGMGTHAAGSGEAGIPWNTSNDLDEPMRSECCVFGSSWESLANKYQLDWGGHWSKGSLDPMHFSVVGDNKKVGRNFMPKYEGRTP